MNDFSIILSSQTVYLDIEPFHDKQEMFQYWHHGIKALVLSEMSNAILMHCISGRSWAPPIWET